MPAVALTLLASAVLALVLPSTASAQRAASSHRVGVLNDARTANHPTVDGLKAGLRDFGLEEGRDVVFDVPITDGNRDMIAGAAGALVKAGVDMIFTSGESATLAAKAATQTIPIVFTLVGDPVPSGIVTSLPRPAGNVTGVSSRAAELVPKRLEVLKALAPALRRVWAISQRAARTEVESWFGLEVVSRTAG